MRRTIIIAATLAACSGGKPAGNARVAEGPSPNKAEQASPSESGAADTSKATQPTKPSGEDVTAHILAMNSNEHGPPPTKFRKNWFMLSMVCI